MTCYGVVEVAGAVVLAVLPGAALGELGRRWASRRLGLDPAREGHGDA